MVALEVWDEPPFEADPHDYCGAEGALRLKQKIEDYWRARGQRVFITLHHQGFTQTMRSTRTDLRSDMIGGLPRSALPSEKP